MNSDDDLVRWHLHAVATGDADAARRAIHPDHVNHMAGDEPEACATPGPAGLLATSAWLRSAFSPLEFEVIEAVHTPERSIVHVWLRGTQSGPFVVLPPGEAPVVFPPTGREFAVRQCHVFRKSGDQHIEHIAVRDDLGMMTQLGHLPPSPPAIARIARWKISGKAGRAVRQVQELAAMATIVE